MGGALVRLSERQLRFFISMPFVVSLRSCQSCSSSLEAEPEIGILVEIIDWGCFQVRGAREAQQSGGKLSQTGSQLETGFNLILWKAFAPQS